MGEEIQAQRPKRQEKPRESLLYVAGFVDFAISLGEAVERESVGYGIAFGRGAMGDDTLALEEGGDHCLVVAGPGGAAGGVEIEFGTANIEFGGSVLLIGEAGIDADHADAFVRRAVGDGEEDIAAAFGGTDAALGLAGDIADLAAFVIVGEALPIPRFGQQLGAAIRALRGEGEKKTGDENSSGLSHGVTTAFPN